LQEDKNSLQPFLFISDIGKVDKIQS
jgi:hypothetical protein